jgi:hypothetical protein
MSFPLEMKTCDCNEPSDKPEPHTCPYAEEIGGDSETLCTCCDACTYECAMNI